MSVPEGLRAEASGRSIPSLPVADPAELAAATAGRSSPPSFQLGDYQSGGGATRTPAAASRTCSACGHENVSDSPTCEVCGTRLSTGSYGIANTPTGREGFSRNTIAVLAAIIVGIVLIWFVLSRLGGGTDPTVPGSGGATGSTLEGGLGTEGTLGAGGSDITVPPTAAPLIPNGVTASSECCDKPATNLIDTNHSTYWNDASVCGVGATLTFTFPAPVTVQSVTFVNVAEPSAFARNCKIQDFQISTQDLPGTVQTLQETASPQTFMIASASTTTLTITVTSAYPGQPYQEQPAFNELALAEVEFLGAVAGAPAVETTVTPTG